MKKLLKKYFKGISWHNRYFKVIFLFIDVFDWILRLMNGLKYLPEYSIRIRSTGIEKQLGGKEFAKLGTVTAEMLIEHAELKPEDKIIEIGCGCGRTAVALSQELNIENYIGLDIDKISIDACRKNNLFLNKEFKFQSMDVYNPVYNPDGKTQAKEYTFPFIDEVAEIVFLISVFTHMLPDDIKRYVREISRLLQPGGQCLFTTFLMDYGHKGGIDFPYDHGIYRLHQDENPEKAIGFMQEFFEEIFKSENMFLLKKPILGYWRHSNTINSSSDFGQDIMIYKKNK